jgi:hypothetical protein
VLAWGGETLRGFGASLPAAQEHRHSTFSSLISSDLSGRRLTDSVQRILREKTSTYPALNIIRRCAGSLAAEHGAIEYRDYVSRLVTLAVTRSDQKLDEFFAAKRQLFGNQLETQLHGRPDCELLSAASFTNHASVVRNHFLNWPHRSMHTCIAFGHPFDNAIRGGYSDVLECFFQI